MCIFFHTAQPANRTEQIPARMHSRGQLYGYVDESVEKYVDFLNTQNLIYYSALNFNNVVRKLFS